MIYGYIRYIFENLISLRILYVAGFKRQLQSSRATG